MRRRDIEDHVLRWHHSPLWYEREALIAYQTGWWLPILARKTDDVYLLRFWLTQPTLDGAHADTAASSEFVFHDALVLHQFLRPDDDGALHDHPAPFRTTVLDGWYREILPPAGWSPHDPLGPQFGARERMVQMGDTIDHEAADLHAVGDVAPGTWSLVRIGDRCRKWGFHPPGKEWQHWRDYLGVPAKQGAA